MPQRSESRLRLFQAYLIHLSSLGCLLCQQQCVDEVAHGTSGLHVPSSCWLFVRVAGPHGAAVGGARRSAADRFLLSTARIPAHLYPFHGGDSRHFIAAGKHRGSHPHLSGE